MSTRCIKLSKEADTVLPELAAQHGLNMSEYLSKLIMDSYRQKDDNDAALREDIHKIAVSCRENGKSASAIVEMLNTYFKMFATGEVNEKEFFQSDQEPHAWTRKAFDVVENRMRMAMYAKHTHSKDSDK
jgi:hypothetical protein